MRISSKQLWEKFLENYGNSNMKPNDVFSGYKAGYRRALKDSQNRTGEEGVAEHRGLRQTKVYSDNSFKTNERRKKRSKWK